MSKQINELLQRRVDEVIEKSHLKRALVVPGKKLRIKFGIDPTSPNLHLGHTVPLLKLKEFQKLGHRIIIIIGDETALIGDPAGRRTARKPLTRKKIKSNMATYKRQISKILDPQKIEFVYNSSWFKEMGVRKFMGLLSSMTFQQISKRREVQDRIKDKEENILVSEILYPIMQGYDSVKVKSDVEIGGTDQKFNLLIGRRVQKKFKQKPQDIITVPILVGTDGKNKMSKSAENYVALEDSPQEMFGKLMSIPDKLIIDYFELCTEITLQKIKDIKRRVISDPMRAKKQLALTITEMYHGNESARKAKNTFEQVVQKKLKPEHIAEKTNYLKVYKNLSELGPKHASNPTTSAFISAAGGTASISEARRINEQGGIDIDEKKISPTAPIDINEDHVIRIGNRYIEYKAKKKRKHK